MTRIATILYVPILVGISYACNAITGSCGNCVFPYTYQRRCQTSCMTRDGDKRPEYINISIGNDVGQSYCGVPNNHNEDSGGEAEIAEYPWQVALLSSKNPVSQFCGGTLVSDRHVVTAAKCTKGKGKSGQGLFVAVGDSNLAMKNEIDSFVLDVKKIRQHPNYDPTAGDNDIAVLELSEPLDLTAYPNIKPICLPAPGATYDNKPAILTGWGTVKSCQPSKASLHEADITIFAKENCGKIKMTDNMICGMSQVNDFCYGDIGGPLIVGDPNINGGAQTLAGVISGEFGGPQSSKGRWVFSEIDRTWLDKEIANQGDTPEIPHDYNSATETVQMDYPPIIPIVCQPNSQIYDIPNMKVIVKDHKAKEDWGECEEYCTGRQHCLFFNYHRNKRRCTTFEIGKDPEKKYTIGTKKVECDKY